MEQIQDVEKQEEGKTWRKDKNGMCLCQSLTQYMGCKYFPQDKPACPYLDLFFKCVLQVSG